MRDTLATYCAKSYCDSFQRDYVVMDCLESQEAKDLSEALTEHVYIGGKERLGVEGQTYARGAISGKGSRQGVALRGVEEQFLEGDFFSYIFLLYVALPVSICNPSFAWSPKFRRSLR